VGQADAQVDHPPPSGRLGDQLGVVAGVGHGGDSLDQGVEERAPAHIRQLAGVLQLPEHSHRIGRFAPVGQAQHRPPDGPVRWPVEVGFLEHGGDLGKQPPRRQDGPEHGFLGLQVVRRLVLGHRT
jgi:hypothetical protein